MGARARVDDAGAGLALRREHDHRALVDLQAELGPEMGGGEPPRIRREINESVDQRLAGALGDEIADETV